jgi:hypothetical protein
MTRTMLALLVLCVPALARDNGQYNSVSPEVRQWFRSQKSPKTGGLCCNEADGTYAEEDIRNGVYWTRFELTGGEWIAVPADVVIKALTETVLPSRGGIQEGKLQIRCYARVEVSKPQWEFPRLCRGGSKSLTYPAVDTVGPSTKLRIVSSQAHEEEFHRWMTMKV